MSVNLYAIEGPWPDADLATAACPRGADWLVDDLRAWKNANIDVVVSALMPGEMFSYAVERESTLCAEVGLEFLHFPINDREAPMSHAKVDVLVATLSGYLAGGRSVVVHCRVGIGRSSLLAACTLVRAGIDVDEVWNRISVARGIVVPDTHEQREWVRRFATHNREADL